MPPLKPRAPRILVVDDDPGILQLVMTVLSRAGLDPRAATGGREAIAAIGQREPGFDLVLTDVVMPGVGGYTVAEACREAAPPIPVVLMTGFATVTAGHFPLLRKPFTPAALVGSIREMLGKQKPEARSQNREEEMLLLGSDF